MKPPSDVQMDRDLVRRGGLAAFVRLAWHQVEPVPYVHNWHIDLICKALEKDGNLSIHVPPGTSKSLIVSVFYPVYLWLKDPSLRIGSISYIPELSLRHAKASRELILSDWFQERWPSVAIDPSAAAGEYETSAGGLRFASSVGGRITGYHFDVLIVDDPLRPNPSKAEVETVRDWWGQVRSTRFRTETSFTVLVMQRVHQLDPGQIAKDQGFRVISIPMRAEAPLCKGDPRKPGQLLWPERFPEQVVQERELSLGPAGTAAQLQQRPAPAGGLVFKSEWWQTRAIFPAKLDKVILSVDASFTAKTSSDYTVIQVWGKAGAALHLLDQDRRQMDMPTACAAVKEMKRKWLKTSAILIEAAANGFAIEQTLRKEGVLGLIPVRAERDKEARAHSVTHLFAAMNVYLPPVHEAPWIEAWKLEMETFPKDAHDDQVDATTMALAHISGKSATWSEAFAAMRARGQTIEDLFS